MSKEDEDGKYNIINYIGFTVLLVLAISGFPISLISMVKFLKEEDIDRDIFITPISGFDFYYYYSDDYTYENHYSYDNFGNTGKVSFKKCSIGKCDVYSYEKDECCEYDCPTSCENSGCCTYKCETCYRDVYQYSKESYSYSKDCLSNDVCSCGSSNKCRCSSEENNKNMKDTSSCTKTNINLYWKKQSYKKYNISSFGEFSYLKSAVKKDENCPKGTRFCGYLDEYLNKFCLSNSYKNCPLNFFTLNSKPNDGYNYTEFYIPGGKIIYATNEKANDTKSRVIERLCIDSDLKIKYSECDIVDVYNISGFINENKDSYVDSLDYDPYEESNIDSKGKSYLRICPPGYGRGKARDLDILKETKENFNKFGTIRKLFLAQFILYAIGFFLIIFTIFISLCCDCSNNNGCGGEGCKEKFLSGFLFSFKYFYLLLSLPILIIGIINIAFVRALFKYEDFDEYYFYFHMQFSLILLFIVAYFSFAIMEINKRCPSFFLKINCFKSSNNEEPREREMILSKN